MLSALVVIIPLVFAIIKRRRMARPFEPCSLNLMDGQPSNESMRYRCSNTSGGSPTETTHLLTLKDAYASIRPRDHDQNKKKPKGRSIVIKSNLEQDPFRLSGGLWDSKNLAAADATTEALATNQTNDRATAAVIDSKIETKTLVHVDT
jgi:hypothetical protein